MPGMDHILSKGFLATGGSVAYKQWQVVKQIAGTTLAPAQCAIMVATTDLAVVPLGVCMEPLDAAKTVTGKAIINVALQGNIKCIWDGVGTLAVGAVMGLSAGTAGVKDGQVTVMTKAIAGAQPKPALGICLGFVGNSMGQAATAGDWIDVQLEPGMMF
jgi:hypothetical protein